MENQIKKGNRLKGENIMSLSSHFTWNGRVTWKNRKWKSTKKPIARQNNKLEKKEDQEKDAREEL